ncbi:MAG: SDR family NAD(P)-dependent oxidoreductase, partial [Myxococcales bacterium]|nr:SDR family NAD(P)-dependent oxidoreductase [Myxococcales bacterium]
IERDENLQLKEFPTLNHVIGWVRQNRPDLAAPASAPTPAPTSTPEMTAPEPSASSTDAVPRRVPRAVLRPALELCKPTGIELSSGDRVIVMCDRSGACAALAEALGQRGVEVLLMEACSTEDFDKHLADIIATGPVAGVFWLPALDAAAGFDALDRDGWRHDTRVYVKLAYRLARALYEQLDSGRFFISATRLGGRHGYDSAGAARPLGGAVSGFTKALSRERGNATIKVVDFELAAEPAAIAQLLIAEAMHDPGACEVGYADQARWTLTLSPGPLPANTAHAGAALALGADTVYVVTGAAGSIVSAIVCDLARTGGTFHLLDLAPAPERENPDLARIDNDLDGLKRDLMQRLQAQSEGKRVTPVMVQKALASIERAAAAKRAMDAIEAAGGSATYHSLDLTDAAAVGDVMGGICKQHGRVDVLMHAAGLEISHFLPDKRPEEFDLVFDVKVDGWLNLLAALGETPLGAAVVFSSIAGRFGNGGQTDYSAANDLLCKHVSSFRSARPATRGIAIDWTAWRDIGMAARGSIPKMMELAGIDMLAPRDGVPVVRRELEHPAANDEIVVAQRLGLLTDELDTSGGLDLDAVSARASGPMTTRVASASIFDGFTVEATLDPSEQPFLYDHQIDGTPVLPGVMGIEAFAEAARVLYPDWHVAAIEDVAFLAPFKFYRNEPRTVTVNAFFTRDGEALIGDFRLRGQRALASGETREQTHFSARVRLEREPLSLPAGDGAQRDDGAPAVKRDDIYRIYFHGPAYRVLDTVWRQGERVAGLMPRELPANHSPSERSTVMAPRLIELCFQTAGVWEIGTTGKLGLPWQIDRVRTFRDPQDTAGLVAVVEPDADGQSFNARVTDGDGNVYVELEGYRTVELGGVDEEARQPLQAVTR